ncbi:hypothetical protein [Roseovarius phycicola]|uniref:DUF1905 domain-containing protein n=1 Tax=Roseovarius phycicola TaxID=3080976 RepID=A0ABZ2HJ12_9RHOB
MPVLPVKRLPANDAGRLLVRLNHSYRESIPRYGIAKLTNVRNGMTTLAVMLGHDDTTAIYMPFDIRKRLGVEKGGRLEFQVTKANVFGKLRWFVCSPDPAVYIPAWIALSALVLSTIGLFN